MEGQSTIALQGKGTVPATAFSVNRGVLMAPPDLPLYGAGSTISTLRTRPRNPANDIF
jgi:hypothetical protein